MTPALLVAGGLLACTTEQPASDRPDPVLVTRVEDGVVIAGVLGKRELDGRVELAGDRVRVDLWVGDDSLVIDVEARSLSTLPPAGTAEGGGARLEVESPIVEGEAHWTADLDGASWPVDHPELVEAVSSGPLGTLLAAWTPLRIKVGALLPEADTSFSVAGLCHDGQLGCASLPAPHVVPGDLNPPGQLAGDVIGLGMTCSPSIRCPGQAPICVTADHATEYGMCTRACIADSDCSPQTGEGRCTLDVYDIPDVTGSVRSCDIDCDEDGGCPGLMTCDQDGRCQADPG